MIPSRLATPGPTCRLALLLGALAAALSLSCSKRPSPPAGPAATGPAGPTASQPSNDQAAERLHELETQGLKDITERRHGALTSAADELEGLALTRPADAALRDQLVQRFRAQAETIRDGLHRFLFVELEPLPARQRKALLASADAGGADALDRSAEALAEHFFALPRRHLRATPTLRAGQTDPQTHLPVRYAGQVGTAWKRQFDAAFNARMRRLALATRPAG